MLINHTERNPENVLSGQNMRLHSSLGMERKDGHENWQRARVREFNTEGKIQ